MAFYRTLLLLVASSLAGATPMSPPSLPASFTAKAILLQNYGDSNPCAFSPGEDCAQWPLSLVQDDENDRSIMVSSSWRPMASGVYTPFTGVQYNQSVSSSSVYWHCSRVVQYVCHKAESVGIHDSQQPMLPVEQSRHVQEHVRLA